MRIVKFISNQRGDTVIEMMIAFVIISSVLIGSYTIANRAFRTTQIARERTQATQFLQQQAEAVYAVYNTMGWQDFKSTITSSGYSDDEFHVAKVAGPRWELRPGDKYEPKIGGSKGIYDIKVKNITKGKVIDSVKLRIAIEWDRIGGGGPKETSTLHLHLTNRNFTGS